MDWDWAGFELAWELSESELRHWSPLSPRGFRGSSAAIAGFLVPVTVCGVEVPSAGTVFPTGSVWGASGLLWLSRDARLLSSRFAPPSFFRPKSGRRMLSMKKLVTRWGICRFPGACRRGRMALFDSSADSCRSTTSLLPWSFSSILIHFLFNPFIALFAAIKNIRELQGNWTAKKKKTRAWNSLYKKINWNTSECLGHHAKPCDSVLWEKTYFLTYIPSISGYNWYRRAKTCAICAPSNLVLSDFSVLGNAYT